MLTVVARHIELSIFVQNTATMLGLGVGVDYSLFVIARFKEELAQGRSVDEALAITLKTSGETVIFSGITIVAAMSTLFLVPLGVISSIALGAVVVVAFSILTSVLLLPVLLRLLGHRINAGRVRLPGRAVPRPAAARGVGRLAARVMRYPLVFLGGALLLARGGRAGRDLTTFTPDAQIVPTSSVIRQGFDRMQSEFGAGSTAPIEVLVTSAAPLTPGGVGRRRSGSRTRSRHSPSVARVDSALGVLAAVSPRAPLTALSPGAGPAAGPGGRSWAASSPTTPARSSSRWSRRIAADRRPAPSLGDPRRRRGARIPNTTVTIGGETAEGLASNEVINDSLPRVIGVMLVVIYLLLAATFRSVLLPLKAILMNLLSVGATFGVLVLVFQHGFGAGLLASRGRPTSRTSSRCCCWPCSSA